VKHIQEIIAKSIIAILFIYNTTNDIVTPISQNLATAIATLFISTANTGTGSMKG